MPASLAVLMMLGGSAGHAVHAAEKTLTGGFDVGPGGFAGNFNPLMATTGYMALTLAYEPLVVYDQALEKVVGRLASSFEISEDQKTYTFHLEPKAKWHDGIPFTSKDVKFTLTLAANKESGSVYAARLGAISSIDTPDEHTVVLHLSKANASQMDTLTKVMMLPEHKLAGVKPDTLPRNEYWTKDPVGTGPFQFKSYVTDQYVEYAGFKDYYRGAPKIDRLINRYFKSTAAAVGALKAGEIQASYIESDDVPTFKSDANFQVISGDSYVVNYLGFNFGDTIWADKRVREAVMYAVDRKSIVESLYGGNAKIANCGYVADRFVPGDINPYGYDPKKAKALLDEAGWDKINGSKPITMLTYYNTPLSDNVMGAMQAMLGQVGINVVPRVVDAGTYNATIYAQKPDFKAFSLVFAGLTNGPDPSNLNIGLNANQIPPNGANYYRADIPAVSQAFDKALSDPDQSHYEANFKDVCKAMNSELPWATLWVTQRYGVASKKLSNFFWIPAPGGGPYDSHPELWDIAN
jgi:peptide/nickel transport system substrate-binding protein